MRGPCASAMLAAIVALSACAGSDAIKSMHLPDWYGPAVTCVHCPDGAMAVEMTVPTGGHQLALAGVTRDGPVATVRVDYAPPSGDLVPQVLTTLRVEVPAERLGDAVAVMVWVGPPGDAAAQLAVATSRPPR